MLKNYNEKKNEQHSFHMVDLSPWPLLTSLSVLSVALSFISYFHYFRWGVFHLIVSLGILSFYLMRWFSDIIVESTFEGYHTSKVQTGVRFGMCLFMASEAMLFFSFFWSFFHCSLSPSVGVGCMWPPQGMHSLDPWGLPLWNTMILLSSGVTVTCVHKAMLVGESNSMTKGFIATIAYGVMFTFVQLYEYNVAPFSMNDGIFGSLFFMLTGFHGAHVLMGTIFLMICYYRHLNYQFTMNQHVGLECGIWYWHFVDVVWIFLFVVIYIWGG